MRGDRLRELREELGLSQKEFASTMKLSEPSVWRYENNQVEPPADVVVRFAEFFNVTADYLLGLSNERGVYTRSDLKPKEQQALDAWRRGDKYAAIKVIVGDE